MKDQHYRTIKGFKAENLTPADLRTIANVLEKYEISGLRFTTGGRLAAAGIDVDQAAAISVELSHFPNFETTNGITYIHFCPGHDQCRYGIVDGRQVAKKLGDIPLASSPDSKIKVSIAACSMCCTEPYVRDVGLLATRKGWKVLFGGNAGGRPRIGDTIAEELDDEQAVELVHRCLNYYLQHKKPKMRTARFMEEVGIEQFREAVLQNT